MSWCSYLAAALLVQLELPLRSLCTAAKPRKSPDALLYRLLGAAKTAGIGSLSGRLSFACRPNCSLNHPDSRCVNASLRARSRKATTPGYCSQCWSAVPHCQQGGPDRGVSAGLAMPETTCETHVARLSLVCVHACAPVSPAKTGEGNERQPVGLTVPRSERESRAAARRPVDGLSSSACRSQQAGAVRTARESKATGQQGCCQDRSPRQEHAVVAQLAFGLSRFAGFVPPAASRASFTASRAGRGAAPAAALKGRRPKRDVVATPHPSLPA